MEKENRTIGISKPSLQGLVEVEGFLAQVNHSDKKISHDEALRYLLQEWRSAQKKESN